MKTTAAVLVETGRPLELMELEIPLLQAGQVLVEILYSGVCHTQVLEARGRRGPDPFLPHCLGHEGTGRVLEVGAGVTRVKPGDRVVMSWIKARGLDIPGCVYQSSLGKVNSGAITTFGHHSVVSENRLTVLREPVASDVAALLGCALPTGMGSVLRTANPSPGQSLAVFGVGGVGIAALLGAVLKGCYPIIAIDRVPAKLELARQLGATHSLLGDEVESQLAGLVPGGLDFAIEASGSPALMELALKSVRQQGGVAVVVGNAPHGQMLQIDPKQLNQGKQLRGTWGGDAEPDVDIPRYARLLSGGRLPGSQLVSRTYALEEVNDALHELEAGTVLRPLLRMPAGLTE